MTARTTQVTPGGDTVAEDSGPSSAGGDQPLVEAELLVEDVSIDGMCGVY
jgi:mycofactocin precursor